MRTITTAAAFAIATSLAAGQESGKSGKSGTKSSKSGDCTDCSADVLTRANMLTSLTYEMYAIDGVINQQSLCDFCLCGPPRQPYLEAVDNTVGCLVDTNCLLEKTFDAFISPPDGNGNPDATIAEGEFLTASVNTLCEAEQSGEDGEACNTTPEALCIKLQLENGVCLCDELPGVLK